MGIKTFEANIKNIGKIHAMPRKVYWLGRPETIRDKDRIEFLTRDIWTINFPQERITELREEKDLIIFMNLDQILLRGRKIDPIESLNDARKLIAKIQEINPLHAIAHTTHINPALLNLFKKNSMSYIEKNLYEINAALNTVIKTVDYIYEKTNRNKREFLRIEIAGEDAISVKCQIEKSKRTFMFSGYIKNISLGGLQIVINGDEFRSILAIKDLIELNFQLGPYAIKIQKAIIARINPDDNCIGIYFDIKNEKMIRDFHANQYMETLYQWLKEIMGSEPA